MYCKFVNFEYKEPNREICTRTGDYIISTQSAKLDLNEKSLIKQTTVRNFTIDAQGFRKTKNENPPTWEIEVTS